MLLFSITPVVAGAAPPKPRFEDRERSLLRERRDLLRNVLVQRRDSAKEGRLSPGALVDAFRMLFQAELDLAPPAAEREALCKEFAREVKKRSDALEGAFKTGRVTSVDHALGLAACREDELRILLAEFPSPANKPAAVRLVALFRHRRDAYQAVLAGLKEEIAAGRTVVPGGEQAVLAAALEAQLDLTDVPEERIPLLQKHLDRLKQWEHAVKTQYEAGRISVAERLEARAGVLAAELLVAREKSGTSFPLESLEEVLREHRKARREAVEVRYVQYAAGECSFAKLLNALEGRLAAELAAAEKADDRIEALKAHLADVTKIERAAKARMEGGLIPQADYEALAALRIEVEVRLLRAERDTK
jgi:hypothetical protein